MIILIGAIGANTVQTCTRCKVQSGHVYARLYTCTELHPLGANDTFAPNQVLL